MTRTQKKKKKKKRVLTKKVVKVLRKKSSPSTKASGGKAPRTPRSATKGPKVMRTPNGTSPSPRSSPRRTPPTSSSPRNSRAAPRKTPTSATRKTASSPRKSPRASPRRRASSRNGRTSPRKSPSSPRRLSIQNYSPRSRQSLMLEDQNDRRILKTPTKKQWTAPSAAFASQSSRFHEERPVTPPPTHYEPRLDLPSARRLSYNNSPFLTTSPRFVPHKSEGPQHFDYEPSTAESVPGVGATALKSKSKRFVEPKQCSPPVGHYNAIPTIPADQNRPSSPFKSSSPRFLDPKPQTQDISSVTLSSFEVKDIRNPSSVFASTSKRFSDSSQSSPGNAPQPSFSPPSSFQAHGSSKAPFGSTSNRFKIHNFASGASSLGPADYSSQDVNEFVYTPAKK
mmetsp:Transcript_8665/g.31965  ORF Transcript_8665/g.31965 Transcript_8665/m.31965 type:complete len:396 (+) Transcript_8665:11431-12618(+)